MQNVLAGEADRAMHLMGDRRTLFRRFRTSDLRGRRFKKDRIVERGARLPQAPVGVQLGGVLVGDLLERLDPFGRGLQRRAAIRRSTRWIRWRSCLATCG